MCLLTFYSFQKFNFSPTSTMTATPRNTPNKGRSLERQITNQDVDCLREAFALFDIDRDGDITSKELGKVGTQTYSYLIVVAMQED